MLTRLRQIVLHPGLIPSNYVEQLTYAVEEERDNKPGKLIKVTPERKIQLQAILAQMIEDSEVSNFVKPLFMPLITSRNVPSASQSRQNLGLRAVRTCFVFLGETLCTVASSQKLTLVSITEVIARDPKCPMVCINFLKQADEKN
jgi:hypothetical protein